MSSSETVDDADYQVTQSSDEALNATVLIPDESTGAGEAVTYSGDNSSFLRIGQYDVSEEGSRSPEHMSDPARGVLVQTTGGLFFTVNEDAYQQYKSNLDLYVQGDLEETIDGNSATSISGTNEVHTDGLSRHSGESFVISTGGYTDVQPGATKDILLKSDNKIDLESDAGVKMAVDGSHWAKIDSEGLWETQFKDAIEVTTGTTHSRFGGWSTEEYYGGSFEFRIAGDIAISFSVSIEISLLLGISVSSIALDATGIAMSATRIAVDTTNIKIESTNIDVSRTMMEVKTTEAVEVTDATTVLNKTGIKLATGMNILT